MALVVGPVVPVPPASLVPVTDVVAPEPEADGAEVAEADPVAEGPVLGDCPELAEVPEELEAEEVPDVWVPEAELTDAEPEVADVGEEDSDDSEDSEDSEAEDELEPEELLVCERKLVDWLEAET